MYPHGRLSSCDLDLKHLLGSSPLGGSGVNEKAPAVRLRLEIFNGVSRSGTKPTVSKLNCFFLAVKCRLPA